MSFENSIPNWPQLPTHYLPQPTNQKNYIYVIQSILSLDRDSVNITSLLTPKRAPNRIKRKHQTEMSKLKTLQYPI